MRLSFIVLATALSLPSLAAAQGDGSRAVYRATFNATWSPATHPGNYPSGAHFSPPVGGTHVADHHFWEPGGIATPGIEIMAEFGSTGSLQAEVLSAINAGLAGEYVTRTGFNSPGTRSVVFEVSKEFPAITLVTMVAPSPDWFCGVDGLELLQNGAWVDSITIPMVVWDAGTDSGTNFTSSNQNTNPKDPIALQDGGPFQAGGPALGTITFERRRSTLVYGSGVNPAGSMRVAGEPQLGETLTLTLDDPTKTMPSGTPTILVTSGVAPSNYPAGRILPGFGLDGGPGELLVGAPFLRIAGPTFMGVPLDHSFPLPTDPALAGTRVFVQGVFLDTSSGGVNVGLTEAVEVRLGG